MSLKKILIILIVLLAIIISALVIYNFFIKKDAEPIIEPDTSQTTPTTAPNQSQIKAISQESVMSPIIDNGKVKYYLTINGNVFESNFDGSESTRLSSNNLTGLLDILWSPSKTKVIALFEENELLKKYLYDNETQQSTEFDANIRYTNWSPIQDKIAYQYYNAETGDNNISIANSDGSQWTDVFSTRMKNLIVEWPNSGKITLRTKPSGLAQSVIYAIDLASGDFKKILDETYGLTVLWSPLGNKLLFSETDERGKNLKLKITDLDESITNGLNFVTLPEKCVWSQDNRTVFCAIPKNISDLATFPDDYYKTIISFSDDFWRINLDTGEKNRIFQAQGAEENAYDAKNLLLSADEDYLLFINKKDGLLYSLPL
ncbi:MAG: hypothetical protein V1829_01215 [bacterium]